MGLHEIAARFIETIKDALDLEQELGSTSLVSRFAELKAQVAELQRLLDATRRASKEKDELIARLQAAGIPPRPVGECLTVQESAPACPAASEQGDKEAKPHKARKQSSPRPRSREQKK